ncbi:MAG: uroporphyrinogen-III C-methyltransferase [Acidobacteriota bacterium]
MERDSRITPAPFLRSQRAPGKVFLVGAGPGDPELITVRGLRLLRAATAVLYDRLIHPALLAECSENCEKIYVGKQVGGEFTQEQIDRLLVATARRHDLVVRLKGGDPFVFGRGGEEVAALQAAGIECDIVPGVSSAIAGPAAAGIPVLDRRLAHSLTIVSGHSADRAEDLAAIATAPLTGTLVILMGVRHLRAIVDALLASGRERSTPVAIIQEATLPSQKTFRGTLETIAGRVEGLRSPAVIVVGDVAAAQSPVASRQSPVSRELVASRQSPVAS